jgi:hypothetical protein
MVKTLGGPKFETDFTMKEIYCWNQEGLRYYKHQAPVARAGGLLHQVGSWTRFGSGFIPARSSEGDPDDA